MKNIGSSKTRWFASHAVRVGGVIGVCVATSLAHVAFAQTHGRRRAAPSSPRAPAGPSRRVTLDSGTEVVCRVRQRPVARAMPAVDLESAQQRGHTPPVVFVSGEVLAVRDANQQIVVRELPSLRQIASVTGDGGILHADANRVILWRREPRDVFRRYAQRALVSIDVATGHETVASPMPLPDWVLETNDPENAEGVRAMVDGTDVVLDWDAVTSWSGGVAPSDEQRAAAHHEDCGSLRVAANGVISEGSYIPSSPAPRPPPPPSGSATLRVMPRYAGDGLYWIDTIDQTTGARSSALVDGTRPHVPVTLPAAPSDSVPVLAGLWTAGTRVVVLRAFQRTETYSMPRDLSVLDRATGAVLWSTPVARLDVLPPRP